MPNRPDKPELLAPAGGWEQLFYALHFGADAVYFACDRFGLRKAADNFTLDEIPRAVETAHAAGAKAYVTLNVYAHDSDLDQMPTYVRAIAKAGADAVLVSDLGVISLVRELAPDLQIHISTQASVSNAAAARAFYALGARRVVCAREMRLSEIARLRQGIPTDMEIEAFVHGAMCMAISGRCLISDFLAGRPANQGQCAQPCRWDYALVDPVRPGQEFPLEESGGLTHLLSSTDLNMLAHLDELRDAGIGSFKIEGRAKSAFYVAAVVNAYRQVIDGEPYASWALELDRVSHRPYSTGFYFGPATQHVEGESYVRHCDWVGEVLSVRSLSDGRYRVEVRCRNRFESGEVLEALEPGAPVRPVHVSDLAGLIEDGAEIVVKAANKTMCRYAFTCEVLLEPHDLLRRRRSR